MTTGLKKLKALTRVGSVVRASLTSTAVLAQLVARRSQNPKIASSILTHRILDDVFLTAEILTPGAGRAPPLAT